MRDGFGAQRSATKRISCAEYCRDNGLECTTEKFDGRPQIGCDGREWRPSNAEIMCMCNKPKAVSEPKVVSKPKVSCTEYCNGNGLECTFDDFGMQRVDNCASKLNPGREAEAVCMCNVRDNCEALECENVDKWEIELTNDGSAHTHCGCCEGQGLWIWTQLKMGYVKYWKSHPSKYHYDITSECS